MTLKCECGETIEDWRGARGHVKFSGGGPHGEKHELPDNYKELFTEIDDDGSDVEDDSDDDPDDDPEPDRDGSRRDRDDDEPDRDRDRDREDDGTDTLVDRLRRAAYEDVRALWGGDR